MEIKSRVTRFAGLLCIAGALQGIPVIYSANPGGIISVARQGTYHLTGTIVDGYGEPVIGANVVEKGTTNGTVTDIDGKFSLEVAPDAVLTISFIGYIPKEITLKGEKELKVVLVEDMQKLDEVVVVGYGTQKKVNLTGAVEQVTSEVFDNRSVPNVTQALQGSIPNLNIQLTDGKPTRSASYNVRGTTSIGQGGSALVLIDGVEGDPSMLNPNDIASVSVLKDAASAAIYGARGTFGVVLITTKEPTKDKTSITYSGNFAMQKPVTVPDFVTDGYEYASHFYEAYHAWNNYSADPKNINKTQEFSLGWLEDFKRRKEQGITDEVTVDATGKYVYYGNEDYYDALYKKTTFAQDHNLSVTGNNGKLNYYVSGRFYGYDGLFRYNTDNYKMMNLRAKGSVQVFDWLKIENNMDFSNMDYHNPINVGEGGSIWRNISDEGHPTSPIFNPDGSLTFSAAYSVGDFIYGKNGIDTNNKVLKNTTGFTASFLENKLHVRGDFTFRNTDEGQTQRRVPVPYSTHEGQTVELSAKYNDLKESNMRTEYIATNLYADYEDTFGDAHYFKGMVGYNYEQSTYKSTYVQRNGLLLDDSENINLALGDAITTSGGYNRWRVAGGFFRLNYAFKDRYLLEVNGRYDGSSKFGKNNKYAFFPSAGLAWNITQEDFMSDQNTISNLKLHTSYGLTGNSEIGVYKSLATVTSETLLLNGTRNSYSYLNRLPNSDLRWEKTAQFDIGFDLGLFNNRITLDASYYNKKTSDLLLDAPVPHTTGFETVYKNIGSIRNQGLDLMLSTRNIDTKDFTWTTSINANFNKNKILSLGDNDEDILKNEWVSGASILRVGESVGSFYGYKRLGVYTIEDYEAGNCEKKQIGRAKRSSEREIIGKGVPDWTGSMINTLRYKNWDFTLDLQFVAGVQTLQQFYHSTYDRFGQTNGLTNILYDAYNGTNPNSMQQAIWLFNGGHAGQDTLTDSQWVANGSYLRANLIQLGYTFDSNQLAKTPFSSLRLYLNVNNAFLITAKDFNGYDPESTSQISTSNGAVSPEQFGQNMAFFSYPRARTFTLGVNVTF